METFVVDPRQTTPEELAEGMRQAQTLFKLGQTMPYTPEYDALVKGLFGKNLGCGAPSAGAPKVFFKYFFVNTVTGEKSGEKMASAVLSNG